MVCSINDDKYYEEHKSWKNTKTNIKEVCLYNENVEPYSEILDYQGCKKLCKIN